jgi:hypothetical protein
VTVASALRRLDTTKPTAGKVIDLIVPARARRVDGSNAIARSCAAATSTA